MTSTRHNPNQIEAIVFDIGRVIVKLDPIRALAHIAKMTAGRNGRAPKSAVNPEKDREKNKALGRELYHAIQRDPMWVDWQEGRVTPAEWHRKLCKRFNVKASFADFRGAWNSTIVSEPELLLPPRLFAQLHSRYRLVLLSNTDPLHVEHMRSNFRFLRHFDAAVFSCEIGASKPSSRIFRAAVRAAETSPKQILFIDDIREYAWAARRNGLQAIQFRNRFQLERELKQRALL
ncbi:MAG TPA: HAD family hydrolase [Candidatus Acidoferrales bacterium]|nr:HAD family hydrolase [Candidatus Acidoferrales bacterium]